MTANTTTRVSFSQNTQSGKTSSDVIVEQLLKPAPARNLSKDMELQRDLAVFKGFMYLVGGMKGVLPMLGEIEGKAALSFMVTMLSGPASILPNFIRNRVVPGWLLDKMRSTFGVTDTSIFLVARDFSKAKHWFAEATDFGSPTAFEMLGLMHLHGIGCERDYLKAHQYFGQAVAQHTKGHVDIFSSFGHTGLSEIAYMYHHGLGVEADLTVARKLYEKAAENIKAVKKKIGENEELDGCAFHALGDIHRLGLGVPVDLQKAQQFYAEAIAHYQSDETAPTFGLHIANLYRFGLGVPANLEAAKKWLSKYTEAQEPFYNEQLVKPILDSFSRPVLCDPTNHLSFVMHPMETTFVYPGSVPVTEPELVVTKAEASTVKPKREPNSASVQQPSAPIKSTAGLQESLAKLDALIGLPDVKSEIHQLVNLAVFNQQRVEQGFKPLQLSMHLIFAGNPGTGKTTVARLLGDIYASLNLLKKGHLVETDRSGLTGQHLGEATIKTKNIVEQALDGVLFIDEAYSLTRPGLGNQYGQEAIDVLLKEMEDNRDRLVVIAAGYSEEMWQFASSNPGLASRFTNTIQFQDYTTAEMSSIFNSFATGNQMYLSPAAENKVAGVCGQLKAAITENFANGRLVRNLFEQAIKNMAKRIAAGDRNVEMMIDKDIPDFAIARTLNTPSNAGLGQPAGM